MLDKKFIVTIISIAAVTASLLLGRIDSNTFSVLISLAVGGFMALEVQSKT